MELAAAVAQNPATLANSLAPEVIVVAKSSD